MVILIVSRNIDEDVGDCSFEDANRISLLWLEHRKLLDHHDKLTSQNSPPSLITTADDFYHRAMEFRDQLVKCRNSRDHGLDSTTQYQRVLRSILEGMYDLVVRPVIGRVRTLNVPEQSRVWLCPTSVVCSLFLHAVVPSGTSLIYISLHIPQLHLVHRISHIQQTDV
ncbi:hypothetical protein BC827DRAFT_603208 [Russula dissimulans]|nr:hypothetical protein BC827DRAFT_603208 [Russula dissimulans]